MHTSTRPSALCSADSAASAENAARVDCVVVCNGVCSKACQELHLSNIPLESDKTTNVVTLCLLCCLWQQGVTEEIHANSRNLGVCSDGGLPHPPPCRPPSLKLGRSISKWPRFSNQHQLEQAETSLSAPLPFRSGKYEIFANHAQPWPLQTLRTLCLMRPRNFLDLEAEENTP